MKDLYFIDINGEYNKIYENIKSMGEAYKIAENILTSHLGRNNFNLRIDCDFLTYGERTYFALL